MKECSKENTCRKHSFYDIFKTKKFWGKKQLNKQKNIYKV